MCMFYKNFEEINLKKKKHINNLQFVFIEN